ncbi:Gfo/Idh/MocA family oxidoreductase (plasmid) [Streptomyces sp. NBC_00390]|uniref:Gfo/Idh/MocA family protein n=1 Tax=Streptomyces sp. NBC_00390 TaxID=2975736 RepID=UPI002E1CD8E9
MSKGSQNPAIRLGVLGCADIAGRRALPAVSRLPQFTLQAVASREPAKAEALVERFGGCPVTGYDALLERDDLDAVYIPLPAALHAPWVRASLDAGLHVLVEKPAALSAAEAGSLAALARRQGRVLMENFGFVRHTQQAAVRKLLDEGAIGELRGMSAEFAFPPPPADDIRYRPELGGGALFDAGVYPLRAARMLLGNTLEVVGAVLRVDTSHGVDVAGSALLTSPAGITAQLGFGFVHSYRCGYTLWGSEGRISLDRAYSAPDDLAPVLRLDRGGRTTRDRLPPDRQFDRMFRAFAEAIRAGDTDSGAHDLLQQAQLVERVAASARRTPLWVLPRHGYEKART